VGGEKCKQFDAHLNNLRKAQKEAPSSETEEETDERAKEGMNLTNRDSPLC
jgi:hypothetical protein